MEEVAGASDGAVGKAVIGSFSFNPIMHFFFSSVVKFRIVKTVGHTEEAGTNMRDPQCVLEGALSNTLLTHLFSCSLDISRWLTWIRKL